VKDPRLRIALIMDCNSVAIALPGPPAPAVGTASRIALNAAALAALGLLQLTIAVLGGLLFQVCKLG
jgi:hypothetical protein